MENRKYKVLFIGSAPQQFNRVWGGTVATCYAFSEAFKNHPKYEVKFQSRFRLKTAESIRGAIESEGYDILHTDDSRILTIMYKGGLPAPDVIGPITRSPVKPYTDWLPIYTPEYFYSAEVIRLNRSEEYIHSGEIDYTSKIRFINHGVDTEFLLPSEEKKTLVMWAGDEKRRAKNYNLWLQIQSQVKLPAGYEYKTMSKYEVMDYWKALDRVKILVNTSLYESFCSAMFEAKSKGVPTIYKEGLHNGRHTDCRIQVDYTVDGYREAITKLLEDEDCYREESLESRKYTVDNFSLKRMAETYSQAYDNVLSKKGI